MESERRQQEFVLHSQMFVNSLDVDEVIAHLLVTEGFSSIEQVAFVPVSDLTDIEGFDEEVAEELRERARNYLEKSVSQMVDRCAELGVSDEIAALEGITPAIMVAVGENKIKSLDDLADLAADELLEMLPEEISMSQAQANDIIMAARAHWFSEDASAETEIAESGEISEMADTAQDLEEQK